MTVVDVSEAAADRLADAFAAGAIDPLELDRTAEAIAWSPIAAALVAAGRMMPFPTEPVFVYWNATSFRCEVCDETRSISRAYWPAADGKRLVRVDLCRPCIGELLALGMKTR